MELIAVLEKAQKTPMPESQKFGILKIIMAHEERPHVRAVYGMASYNKESFNATIRGVGYYTTREGRGSHGGKHRTTVL